MRVQFKFKFSAIVKRKLGVFEHMKGAGPISTVRRRLGDARPAVCGVGVGGRCVREVVREVVREL